MITRSAAYHGTNGFGTSLGGIEPNRVGFGPLVLDTSNVVYDSVAALEEEILRIGPDRVAAFFAEPVIGAGGVYPPAGRLPGGRRRRLRRVRRPVHRRLASSAGSAGSAAGSASSAGRCSPT